MPWAHVSDCRSQTQTTRLLESRERIHRWDASPAGSVARICSRPVRPSTAFSQPPSRSWGQRPTSEPPGGGTCAGDEAVQGRRVWALPHVLAGGLEGPQELVQDLPWTSSRPGGAFHALKCPADVGPDRLARPPVTASHRTTQMANSLFRAPPIRFNCIFKSLI